jgi:ADP-ribosyl-[dinitrogen reductase] hydrolase
MKGTPKQKRENLKLLLESRKCGCIYGLFIGDALSMPVHWYYDRAALKRDYGTVRDYLAPRNPHPDSILWRSSYNPLNKKGDILHDQAQYWGKKGIHYHQFLRAGENTLNLKLCKLLIESLNEKGAYESKDYLERYISYMTLPGNHKDTYVEEYHRHFFTKFAQGVSPFKCGVKEKHIGGLVGIAPVVAFYQDDPEKAKSAALEHLSITHLGKNMELAGLFFAELLLRLFKGMPLREALINDIEGQKSPFVAYPFLRWLKDADDFVVGRRFSTACYVEDSVPAVIYLALKYHDNPEKGLIANTNLGGDNAYRGAVLGAILGAANGMEGFPNRWIKGLREPPPELASKKSG